LRKIAFSIKNSPTIIRPKWFAIITELSKTPEGKKAGLTVRAMPRDVPTRWNSTYDMLKFAYTYREAIDMLTDDRTLKLRDCEMKPEDWEAVKQLRDCLKVQDITCAAA
jgi:hypothetical protein